MRRIIVIAFILSMLIGNAQVWVPLNNGLSKIPTAITSKNQLLAVAQVEKAVDGKRLHTISIWNRYSWTELPRITADSFSYISALFFYKDHLYIGGKFSTLGNIKADNLLRWNGKRYEEVPWF
jgi:hypothetical protein